MVLCTHCGKQAEHFAVGLKSECMGKAQPGDPALVRLKRIARREHPTKRGSTILSMWAFAPHGYQVEDDAIEAKSPAAQGGPIIMAEADTQQVKAFSGDRSSNIATKVRPDLDGEELCRKIAQICNLPCIRMPVAEPNPPAPVDPKPVQSTLDNPDADPFAWLQDTSCPWIDEQFNPFDVPPEDFELGELFHAEEEFLTP